MSVVSEASALMSCYLGIDYGGKRIGLSVSDAGGQFASPFKTVPSTGRHAFDADAVIRSSSDYDVTTFVIGLPLNMDGTEGPQAKVTRKFGTVLAQRSRLPVLYWDERLSTVAADELMSHTNLTRKKKKARRDPLAATVILQEFLDRDQGADHPQ